MDAVVVALSALFAMLACTLAGMTWLVRGERRVRRRAGMAEWASGLGMQALAWMLLATVALVWPAWSVPWAPWLSAAAGALLVAGWSTQMRALLLALDVPAATWQGYLAPAAVFVLLALPVLSPEQRGLAAWLAAALAVVPFLRTIMGLALRRGAWPQRCVAVAFLVTALACGWRVVELVRGAAPVADGLLSPAATFALGWCLVAPVFATFAFLMLQQQRRRTWLEGLATRDPLTGTRNRRAFYEQAERLTREQRGGRLVAWLMIDIDAFEAINERHGREVGDVLLGKVADELRDTLRGHDIAGHFGGDEFCALLFDVDAGEASERAERLRQRISARPIGANGALVFTTISIGVAHARADRELDFESLMAVADKRLYLAKRAGRNRVVAADVSFEAAAAPAAARPGALAGR